MQNRHAMAMDPGVDEAINDDAPEIPATPIAKVFPFVNKSNRTYMVRPEPSWSTDSE